MSEPNDEYQPIPVAAAEAIAAAFSKAIVIILAWDPKHGMLHTTTYGTDPENRAWAAQGGEIAAKALNADLAASKHFEDYRLTIARKLLAALELVLKIAEEADGMQEPHQVLRRLLKPRKGLRYDVDAIHEVLEEAKKLL